MDTVWTAKQVILDKIYQVSNTNCQPLGVWDDEEGVSIMSHIQIQPSSSPQPRSIMHAVYMHVDEGISTGLWYEFSPFLGNPE